MGLIQKDSKTGIEILLAKSLSANPVDMFSSRKFKDAIEYLGTIYDHIIIDSPPVLAVPDARILGRLSHAIILNVAWNRTSRTLVKEAVRQFHLADLKITGVVLCQIDAKKMEKYGYGSYNHYAYNYDAS